MNGQIYRRDDGKYAWRIKAGNNEIVATDGGQGYENLADCEALVYTLFPNVPFEIIGREES